MYRILLVDDEALIREAVSENVPWGEYGYELAGSCENGLEALDFIKANSVDVVLTDICMPYFDGIQLSEVLCEKYPSVKIIILSGYDEFEYAKKAIKCNVKEYLLKPITAHEMGEVLEKLRTELDGERAEKTRLTKMKSNYYRGQVLLYSNVLLNLITGSKNEDESRRELEEVGVCLEAETYRVAVLELDIYAKADKLDETLKKESALMAFVLYNITEEIVKSNRAGEVCQGNDLQTCILFTTDMPVKFNQTVKDVCREIIEQINNNVQLTVNIGIGSYVDSMKDIYRSYEDAEKALEYRYVLGSNNIMESDIINKEKGEADIDRIVDMVSLHMRENSSAGLENDFGILSDVFRDYLYDRRSVGTVLQRMADMADEMRKASEIEVVPDSMNKEQILKKALEAAESEEAVEIVSNYCMEIGDSLDTHKNVGGKKYAVSAMDYIAKNYADCNLSLHSVCTYLNISTSRFSSIFKNAMGVTFMESVINLRMQKAGELIKNTDLKYYEIAEKVGFNDPHYFSIAFKKAMGQTPTEYAKENKQ